jgi:hypothetical protein
MCAIHLPVPMKRFRSPHKEKVFLWLFIEGDQQLFLPTE